MSTVVVLPVRRGARSEPWLSKRQIAAHYGRSTRWIELRVREGLPSRMLGGKRAFRLSEVDTWISARYA
jgi:predicted DNA-binding transcriptional regulator AlpA